MKEERTSILILIAFFFFCRLHEGVFSLHALHISYLGVDSDGSN